MIVQPITDSSVKVSALCPLCGKVTSTVVNIGMNEFHSRLFKYKGGAHLQDAFDCLPPFERDFIAFGYCQKCVDKMDEFYAQEEG